MTKNQTKSRPKAVIWDMDGVIADTGPYHFKAWHKVFLERGVELTEEDFKKNFGKRNDTIIRNTLGDGIAMAEIEAISEDKETTFRRLVKNNMKPLPGVTRLIKALARGGFKQALGSSAPVENVWLILKSLGIADAFQAIASGDEVTEGKPSPQGFLLAARKLAIEPRNCVVIEDAVAGVTAAKRAGMKCLAVTNTHPRASLAEADLVVDTLEEITPSVLEGLFNCEG
ncbi:MAG TPA: HAD family phosphatase [Dehalococcoidia bacterium]|nr:HAD family phosphatase [Dehalococcoidia bacterium]